jgi:AcrR family transcriptional regulator
MSRRIREVQARRHYILDAARRLFTTKGVENTSMEDIAAAAEYTRRTLYSYFRSRDEIFLLACLEDTSARWDYQTAAMKEAGTGLAKLLAFGRSFYEFSRTHPQSLRLQAFWDFRGINRERIGDEIFDAFSQKNEELAEGLRAAFRLGIGDGSLRPDLPVDFCISSYLVTLRSALNRALFPTYSFAQFDADEYVNNYLDLFTRGVGHTKGE